jgi:hypothetical protein
MNKPRIARDLEALAALNPDAPVELTYHGPGHIGVKISLSDFNMKQEDGQTPATAIETHPVLTRDEMAQIASYRAKLAYKTPESCIKLLYEWTKTGKISFREFNLLTTYLFKGY